MLKFCCVRISALPSGRSMKSIWSPQCISHNSTNGLPFLIFTVPYCLNLSRDLSNGETPIFSWKVEPFTDIPCRRNHPPPLLQRQFNFVVIISENNALVLKTTSVLFMENASGWSISVQRAGHVFESRSRIGRILLIVLLKLRLLKIRRRRQNSRPFFAS